ncbi:MAG: hypothetical protein H0T60_01980 [Acidobacteria bacterium]|nr:hypothetical protein [Acidobacteriota bacterium]
MHLALPAIIVVGHWIKLPARCTEPPPQLHEDDFTRTLFEGKLTKDGSLFDFFTKNRLIVANRAKLSVALKTLNIDVEKLTLIDSFISLNVGYYHFQVSDSFDLVVSIADKGLGNEPEVLWMAITPHTSDSMIHAIDDEDNWKKFSIRDGKIIAILNQEPEPRSADKNQKLAE